MDKNFCANTKSKHPTGCTLKETRGMSRFSHQHSCDEDFYLRALKTFGRLSLADDSSVRQNSKIIVDSPRDEMVNGTSGGEYRLFPPRTAHEEELQRLLESFKNGVASFGRNRVSYQKPWNYPNGSGYGINNSWRNNDDQALYMKNMRIFEYHISHICELMVDPFGNYVAMMLMEECNSEHIIQIVDNVTRYQDQFIKICSDHHGSKAIQSLLEKVKILSKEDQIMRILESISRTAVLFSKNSNALNVILTCFREFTSSQCKILLEVICQNFCSIVTNKHGSCMIQKYFDNDHDYEMENRFLTEIIFHAKKLSMDSYGNFVVQFVAKLNNKHAIDALVAKMIGSYVELACDRYGSHVVQKLLDLRDFNSTSIIKDLMKGIGKLVIDEFGNYVIHTAWTVSTGYMRDILREHIRRNIESMRCNIYGTKLLEKLRDSLFWF